jgi:hypothetical protein
VVVFPQAPELSTGRPRIAKNYRHTLPQPNSPSPVDQIEIVHTSTTPYYN